MPSRRLLAIDPGPVESAWVDLDRRGMPVAFGKVANAELLDLVRVHPADAMAMEMVASYGMPVGAEVFGTAVWAGRFIQRWHDTHHGPVHRRTRKEVARHLCHSHNAGDKNVRQALIDRYGPGKAVAIGLKASPGPLYGVSKDVWQALGVAITALET